MKKISILIVLTACMCAGAGCAHYRDYMHDRALDLADCFKLDVGVGLGFDVHVMLTDAIVGGVGFSDTFRAGYKARHFGTWHDIHGGLPLTPIIACFTKSPGAEFFVTDFSIVGAESRGSLKPITGGYRAMSYVLVPYKLDKRLRPGSGPTCGFEVMVDAFDLEVGITALLVGVRVGFSFGQFADFLLGWFGVDIAGDDEPVKKKEGEPEPPEKEETLEKLTERWMEVEVLKVGWTPLHLAAEEGSVRLAGKLIDKNANVHARTKRGNTPLHFAAIKGRAEVVELLIYCKSNPDSQNEEGLTPLHYAAMYNNVKVARILISKGAKRRLKDKTGRTPLDCAVTREMKELLKR